MNDTLGGFLNQLPDLPLTFKDCLFTARKLNVRYVWIDSLCIIQDDEDDWARESAVMNKVYMNSLCTIAADASQCAYGGIFRKISQHRTQDLLLQVGESTVEVVDDEIFSEVEDGGLQTVGPIC